MLQTIGSIVADKWPGLGLAVVLVLCSAECVRRKRPMLATAAFVGAFLPIAYLLGGWMQGSQTAPVASSSATADNQTTITNNNTFSPQVNQQVLIGPTPTGRHFTTKDVEALRSAVPEPPPYLVRIEWFQAAENETYAVEIAKGLTELGWKAEPMYNISHPFLGDRRKFGGGVFLHWRDAHAEALANVLRAQNSGAVVTLPPQDARLASNNVVKLLVGFDPR